MNYELILGFDRDCSEYTRGVEVGMIYGRLEQGDRPVRAVAHTENIEMMFRLAEAFGTSVSACELDADWLAVTFD